MNVWVDQDLCTGDGLCEELCPSVFAMRDGISYVRAVGAEPRMVGGSGDMVTIPPDLLDAVLDAAEECPGECIFIEP
jgi:ferredoxin